ncbi:vomeronasal type-1 receptor 4-like [Sarcophilus harrisii]|uniref:Vomeronasal type-1 receptor n=1 Tax=Sarcophilus harrisii TaxID=9305 RepID=G3VK62_SARHA|nr:vomeronasal type-1 receptor 4-like [Sarcophilus harrisii]
MNSNKEGLQNIYLTMVFFGILGNLSLIYLHSLKLITGHRKRLISLIIINLSLAHVLMILLRGIPTIIAKWGWRSFLDETMGKILTYLIRVTQGISLSNTCLLSVFQAIIISPNSLKWAKVKTRAQKYIPSSCILSWVFNLLLDIATPLNISTSKNSSNERWRIGHVSFDLQAKSIIKILICVSFVDALFMGLMICSSCYMMSVLHRHNQRVQHIHSSNYSHKASPENRATKAILMLVVTFVCFNSVSSPFVIYVASAVETRRWGLQFIVTLSMFYPIVSPFVLIGIDTQKPRFFCHSSISQELFSRNTL